MNCLGLSFPGSRTSAPWGCRIAVWGRGYFPATLDAGDLGMEREEGLGGGIIQCSFTYGSQLRDKLTLDWRNVFDAVFSKRQFS